MSSNLKKYLKYFCLVVIIAIILFILYNNVFAKQANQGGLVSMDQDKIFQTDVDGAEHLFDKNGVPILRIKGIGEVRHPGGIAVYALQYAGLESYAKDKAVSPNKEKFRACVNWLATNWTKNDKGDLVWLYNFDNTYNDVFIKAPWYSAFGQAVAIEALIASYRIDGNSEHLALAERAASVLFRPIEDSGLLFKKGDDIWFEEISVPRENPTHILNGHMRTLISLKQLAEVTGKSKYQDWFDKGVKTLKQRLPLYDNGYWLRYDLNPKKDELLFRFTNPYGFEIPELAIDKITLKDPKSGEEVSLDVGAPSDAKGSIRITGNDWGQVETIDDRTVRRLKPVTPATAQEDADGGMHSPYTFYYLKLPSGWTDNLREDWFDLTIDYKDEKPGNVTVQLRSIAPGPVFRDMRDGDLLLSGSGQWRQWRIPVRSSDLGWWVGKSYTEKHLLYLEKLSKYDPALLQLATVTKGYLDLVLPLNKEIKLVNLNQINLPQQTPMLDFFSFDNNGVLRQHQASKNNVFTSQGWDHKSQPGPPVYSPFIISEQAFYGEHFFETLTEGKREEIKSHYGVDPLQVKSEPAYKWIAEKAKSINENSVIWEFEFNNAYNDIISKSPWQSAFGQDYIIKALMKAVKEKRDKPEIDYASLLQKAINAYMISIEQGGIKKEISSGSYFFEEVPNGTHVLNAHLASMVTLKNVTSYNNNETANYIFKKGVNALKDKIWAYDTGYWSRYDQNPKKEILCQIDWLSGDKSPAISEIDLHNLQTGKSTSIDVGANNDFTSYPHLSGTDWLSVENLDGKTVRHFRNGYILRKEPLEGGARHNVFFMAALPERSFDDYFDVPPHQMVICYKDEAPGEFVIKTQAINNGNILTFIPLHNGILRCMGDGQWKEAVFTLLPQDMGWYMGLDYQKFHVEQLKELASQTGDWFFVQYAEKWQYYLDAYNSRKPVVIETHTEDIVDVALEAKVIQSVPTYPGYEVDNALDGNPNDDYVASIESPPPYSFIIGLNRESRVRRIELIWENDKNYAEDYIIQDSDYTGKSHKTIVDVKNMAGKTQKINLSEEVPSSFLKFTITKVTGQQRLLLRQIKVLASKPAGMEKN